MRANQLPAVAKAAAAASSHGGGAGGGRGGADAGTGGGAVGSSGGVLAAAAGGTGRRVGAAASASASTTDSSRSSSSAAAHDPLGGPPGRRYATAMVHGAGTASTSAVSEISGCAGRERERMEATASGLTAGKQEPMMRRASDSGSEVMESWEDMYRDSGSERESTGETARESVPASRGRRDGGAEVGARGGKRGEAGKRRRGDNSSQVSWLLCGSTPLSMILAWSMCGVLVSLVEILDETPSELSQCDGKIIRLSVVILEWSC